MESTSISADITNTDLIEDSPVQDQRYLLALKAPPSQTRSRVTYSDHTGPKKYLSQIRRKGERLHRPPGALTVARDRCGDGFTDKELHLPLNTPSRPQKQLLSTKRKRGPLTTSQSPSLTKKTPRSSDSSLVLAGGYLPTPPSGCNTTSHSSQGHEPSPFQSATTSLTALNHTRNDHEVLQKPSKLLDSRQTAEKAMAAATKQPIINERVMTQPLCVTAPTRSIKCNSVKSNDENESTPKNNESIEIGMNMSCQVDLQHIQQDFPTADHYTKSGLEVQYSPFREDNGLYSNTYYEHQSFIIDSDDFWEHYGSFD